MKGREGEESKNKLMLHRALTLEKCDLGERLKSNCVADAAHHNMTSKDDLFLRACRRDSTHSMLL
jgi:hypothetical protein